MSTTLPPAPSEKALSAALDGFAAAVGSAAVLTSEAELAEFRDPFAYATWDEYTASAVVMPTTVEEIQDVLRVANEHKVPLWTHGQGRNNGYGGPAPRVRGSVIVSLRNMNRVLEIDEECAYAVVEPGVRWFDLYDAIQAGGHKLWLSIADLGWGSVIGNTLDHGVTYLPYGQDMAAQCGMEVVLANGDVLRTGMGAMPDNKVVARLQARPRPDARPAVHAVQLRDRHEDGRLADAAAPDATCRSGCACGRTTTSRRWSTRCASCCSTARSRACRRIYNTICLGSVLSSRSQWYDGEGPIPDAIDRSHRARARDRALDHPLRAVGRRGRRRPPLRQDQARLRADPRRRGVGHQARPRRRRRRSQHPADLIQAGVPEPRLEQHDRLVRRRGGRPHRLLADRAAHGRRRARRCATSCAA